MIRVEDIGADRLERVNKILSRVPGGAIRASYAAMKRAGQTAKTKAGQFAAAEYTISKGTFMANVNMKSDMSGGAGGVASLNLLFAGAVLPLKTFQLLYVICHEDPIKLILNFQDFPLAGNTVQILNACQDILDNTGLDL